MTQIHINEADAPRRQVDPSLAILDLCTPEDFPFDLVIGELDGPHHKVINSVSDKAYFILSGSGTMTVGESNIAVRPGDNISVPAGTSHSLNGKMRYLIVTSPRFNIDDERVVSE